MTLDQLLHLLVEKVKEDSTKDKAVPLAYFKFERQVNKLVKPSREQAEHHRKREHFYTVELEKAEKVLRETGISIEVLDPKTGFSFDPSGSLCSGAISIGNVANFNNPSSLPKFQPRINQDLLAIVERSKTKMLEHRSKAEQFEKYARTFACCPDHLKVELTVEDVHFFQLEN